jgi:hypothetical protein
LRQRIDINARHRKPLPSLTRGTIFREVIVGPEKLRGG